MLKNALTRNFNYNLEQRSPVIDDFRRVDNVSHDGVSHPTFEKVNYRDLQKSNGNSYDWSLKSMLDAGINPDCGIHTGFNTRLEGVSKLMEFEVIADSLLVSDDIPSADISSDDSISDNNAND